MKGNMSNMVTDADKQLDVRRQRFDPGDVLSVVRAEYRLCVCSRVFCGRISTDSKILSSLQIGSPRLRVCCCFFFKLFYYFD